MTLKQALALLGIKTRPKGKTECQNAAQKLKSELVAAHRDGNHARAAQLSQAREAFKKHLGVNTCEVCGTTISGRATRCRIHQQEKPKQLPKPKSLPLPFTHKSTGRAGRKRNFPISNLSEMGYWSAPVQEVVNKWVAQWTEKTKPGKKDSATRNAEAWCQHYLAECFYSVFYADDIKVQLATKAHQGYVFDLLTALNGIYSDKKSPIRWVLETCSGGSSTQGYHPDSWEEIQKTILQRSGMTYGIDALKTCGNRLRLNDSTVPKSAPEWCAHYVAKEARQDT